MSSGIKCPQCGLINWATDAACKRCGTNLQDQNYQQPPSYQGQSYQPTDYQAQSYQPGTPQQQQNVGGESPMSLPQFGYANFAGAPSSMQANALDPELGGKVWRWYVAYCVLMALIYVACAVMGGFLLFFDFPGGIREAELSQIRLQGGILMVIGVVFLGVFAVAPFLPKKPWNWIYGICLIALGMTSCCLLPITIPLLIQWLKPELRAFFGRPA